MLNFLISLILGLFCFALLLRAWIYAIRVPGFNPLGQNIFKFTNWYVAPLQKIFKPRAKVETACLAGAYLVCLVHVILVTAPFAAWTAPYIQLVFIQSLVLFLTNILNLIFWTALLYGLMSWISPRSPAMMILGVLLEPLLRPIRNLPFVNALQGIDLSPLILMLGTKLIAIAITSSLIRVPIL